VSESNHSDKVSVDSKPEKTCFIIMPIADMDGYEPGHFLRVYNHIIKPACEKSGFKVVRADDVTASNFIVLDILKKIVECDLAICDLSGRNPNVMYELGLRQAFNKKTVLIKDNKTTSPFDVQAFRYCEYDSLLRIDNAQKNVQNLSQAINTTYNHDENDVNSVVQLLKIQPAQVGEKTILSQENTLILQAIKELEEKIKHLNSNNIPTNKTMSQSHTSKGEDLGTQSMFYAINELVGNWYTKNGTDLGFLDGIVKDKDGNKFYKFSNGKGSYRVPTDSPDLAFIIDEGIPF